MTHATEFVRGRGSTASLVAGQILLAAVILCLPGLMLGRPFAFYDSVQYFQVGHSVWNAVVPLDPPAETAAAASQAAAAADSSAKANYNLFWLAARSPFYAAPLYAVSRLGGLWAVAALQALLLATLLRGAVGVVRVARPGRAYLGLIAMLTAASSAPFYATFLMPDVFAAMAVLGALLVMIYGARERIGLTGLLLLWGLVVFAGALHATHPFLIAATAVAGGLGLWVLGSPVRKILGRMGIVFSALLMIALLSLGVSTAVKMKLGTPPEKPPYLMARLLADGVGRAHLAATCPESGYALCAYRDRPLTDANDFLWNTDAERGVFMNLGAAERQALIEEEKRFVLDVAASNPLGVVLMSVRNTALQLISFGVRWEFSDPIEDLSREIYWSRTEIAQMLPNMEKCRRDVALCQHPAAWFAVDVVQYLVVGASIFVLGSALFGSRGASPLRRAPKGAPLSEDQMFAAATVSLGVVLVVDAALCGALSGPADRYLARVIWLLPFFAGLQLLRSRTRALAGGQVERG